MSNWVTEEKGGLLTRLSFADDPVKMNWISEGHPWGITSAPEGIVCHSSRRILPEDILEEEYTFVNMTDEVAIRHWDGYWFGKRGMLGDTFPHYWSSLTGQVFERYGRITGEKEWLDRAERNLRGSLSLFFPDGSASCAMVYPSSVNGETAHFYDPWANDQDWGLYHYFRRG